MKMRGFDFVRSCTCNTVFELLACFIPVVLLYVLFCYFTDLIWWCGWYIGYSKQVSKGTVDSELLMKHGNEIWTDWGESYWHIDVWRVDTYLISMRKSWNVRETETTLQLNVGKEYHCGEVAWQSTAMAIWKVGIQHGQTWTNLADEVRCVRFAQIQYPAWS